MTDKNPFPKSSFFATPDSPEALLEYCERFTGQDKHVAMLIAAMAMNLAHEMYNKELTQE